jgi:hypothetical protein
MTFGQILDRIYRLMRSNLRLFLGIAAVPSAAFLVVMLPAIGVMLITVGPQLRGQTGQPAPFLGVLAGISMVIGELVLLLVFALYMPAASYAATQADLGIRVSFREAYGVGWRRYGRYVWLMILSALYILVPVAACVLAIALGAIVLHFGMGAGSGSDLVVLLIPLGILLYLAVLVYSILIILRFSLAYPACAAEGLTARASLRRSVDLTRGAKGRIFLVLLVVYAFTYLVTMACMAVFFAVGAVGAFAAILSQVTQGSPAFCILIGLAVLGYLLIMVACCLFSYAAFTAALAVIYHDQRLRRDGRLPAPSRTGEDQV